MFPEKISSFYIESVRKGKKGEYTPVLNTEGEFVAANPLAAGMQGAIILVVHRFVQQQQRFAGGGGQVAADRGGSMEEEMAVLERFSGTVKPQESLQPVCAAADVVEMQNMIGTVYCSKEVRHYIANIAAMPK